MTDDLDSLLSGARRRSPEALAALCERVYPRVLRYMRYRAGAAHAEDLTEEVFLRVVRSIHRQSGTFEAWLYRSAVRPLLGEDSLRGKPPPRRRS